LDLLPYWLLGGAPGLQLDEAATVQMRVADASCAQEERQSLRGLLAKLIS
jgi:hypothetical protein